MIDNETLKKIDAILEKAKNRSIQVVSCDVIDDAPIKKKKISKTNLPSAATQSSDLSAGDLVRLIDPDIKHAGKEGRIIKVGRKNFHIEINGLKTPVFLQASQVIKI